MIPTDDIAISVRGLSKAYTIAHNSERHITLAETALAWLKNPLRRGRTETFWALRDLSFDIARGDVVGVIGRNGAGKSTLLKILSRITEPTRGEIDLFGRVGSLLEVGTGFHPELTGRENIYLNGAILGMRRKEIDRHFDAIVDFAEIEKFLDTPVKRYSSGMYVRLAFAVAAHLNSEILVVDEVLAVGDADFQKKCLGKMRAVGEEGRTVILVSHSMPVIQRLCTRAILLGKGQILSSGHADEIARQYLDTGGGSPSERRWTPADAPGDAAARLLAVRITDGDGNVAEVVDVRKPVFVEIEYENLRDGAKPTAAFHLINDAGIVLFASADFSSGQWRDGAGRGGVVRSTCRIPANFLAEGRFSILAAVCSYNPDIVHAIENDAVSFLVMDRSSGDGVRGPAASPWPGVLRPMLDWEIDFDLATDQQARASAADAIASAGRA